MGMIKRRTILALLLVVSFHIRTIAQPALDTTELRNHAIMSYAFDRIFSGKEVRRVGLDQQGFLWFTIPPATIMRWNGRESRIIDRLADGRPIPQELISFPQRDIRERPIWCNPSKRNQWMQVDDDGKLRVYQVDSTRDIEMSWSYWGSSALWQYPANWKQLPTAEQQTRRGLINEWRFRYRFFVDSSQVYVLDTGRVFFLSDTLRLELPGRIGWKHASGCRIGKYWLALQADQYFLYDQARLIDAGRFPMGKVQVPNDFASLIWDAQFLGDTTIVGLNDRVVRFSVQAGKLKYNTLVKLPGLQTYSGIFWHASAEKLFVIPARGGFIIYEPKLFQAIPLETPTELLCYSVLEGPAGKQVTNVDFRHAVDWQRTDRFVFAEQSAVVWNDNRREYYYAHHNFFYVLDADRRLKKRIPISGGVSYSMHLTDSMLYFHASDLYQYRPGSNSVEMILPQGESGMDMVYYLYPYQRGKLWVAKGNFIGVFDTYSRQWRAIHTKPLMHIRSVWMDTQLQRIWVTTNGYGIYFLNPTTQHQEPKALPVQTYPALLYAHYVLTDAAGDYWIPTNKGLFNVLHQGLNQWLTGEQASIAVRYFGKPQGLVNEEFNGGFSSSGYIKRDTLYLASMAGVVRVYAPDLKAREAEVRRQILIDRILLNDEYYPQDALGAIDPDYRRLTILVDYAYVEHPTAELRFRILGGLDTAWYAVPADGEIRLPNFRPGAYQLELVSSLEPGASVTRQLPFRIRQYWYLRWWAWALYIFATAGITYVALRWRFARKEFEAANRLSVFRKQLLSWVGHDLRSPVVSHRAMTQMLPVAVEQQNWEAVKQMSQLLASSSHSMELLIQNLVQWGKLDTGEIPWKPESIDLPNLVQSFKELYRFHAETNGISVEFPEAVSTRLTTDSNLLQLLLRNLIDNAIKNADRGSVVTMKLEQSQKGVRFCITNVSRNPDKAFLQRIQTWVQHAPESDSEEEIAGLGLGMVAIKTALHRLGGTMNVICSGDTVCFQADIPQVASETA